MYARAAGVVNLGWVTNFSRPPPLFFRKCSFWAALSPYFCNCWFHGT